MWLGGSSTVQMHGATVGVKALEAATGKIVWEHGEPASGGGGVGVLTTAGGLTFSGFNETFFALRTSDGAELWRARMGGRINAAPISYMVGDTQYVAIAAGGAFFAFTEGQ